MRYFILLTLLFSLKTHAAAPSFSNINSSDFEKLNKEFATNFLHTTVSPASSSSIFGVEVGLIGGVTDTPNIDKFSKEVDPSADITAIPHGFVFATVAIPMGMSFDLGLLPETELGSIDIKHFALAAKWNFFSLAVLDLAAKAHYSSSTVAFKQTVSNIKSDISIEQKSIGVDLIASGNFIFAEPYIGLGFVSTSSTIDSAASASIFDNTFTTGSSAKDDYSSAKILAGVQFNLFLVHIGLEYMNVYSTSRFSGKLSFYF